MALFNLNNKLAMITGAASGIGLATAGLFASQGANLALIDVSPKISQIASDLNSKYPNQIISSHIFDLTVPENIDKLFKQIQSEHPNYLSPTILVNSAGIGQGKPLTEITEQDYTRMIDVNIKVNFDQPLP